MNVNKSKMTVTVRFEARPKCDKLFGKLYGDAALERWYRTYMMEMVECLALDDCQRTGNTYTKADKHYEFGNTGKVYYVDRFKVSFNGKIGELSLIMSGEHCAIVTNAVVGDFTSFSEFGYVSVISTIMAEPLDE